MLARQRTTAPVSMRALIARINRKLADKGEVLKAARSERVASSVGLFFIVRRNAIAASMSIPRSWPASWAFSALGSTSNETRRASFELTHPRNKERTDEPTVQEAFCRAVRPVGLPGSDADYAKYNR